MTHRNMKSPTSKSISHLLDWYKHVFYLMHFIYIFKETLNIHFISPCLLKKNQTLQFCILQVNAIGILGWNPYTSMNNEL